MLTERYRLFKCIWNCYHYVRTRMRVGAMAGAHTRHHPSYMHIRAFTVKFNACLVWLRFFFFCLVWQKYVSKSSNLICAYNACARGVGGGEESRKKGTIRCTTVTWMMLLIFFHSLSLSLPLPLSSFSVSLHAFLFYLLQFLNLHSFGAEKKHTKQNGKWGISRYSKYIHIKAAASAALTHTQKLYSEHLPLEMRKRNTRKKNQTVK